MGLGKVPYQSIAQTIRIHPLVSLTCLSMLISLYSVGPVNGNIILALLCQYQFLLIVAIVQVVSKSSSLSSSSPGWPMFPANVLAANCSDLGTISQIKSKDLGGNSYLVYSSFGKNYCCKKLHTEVTVH